MSEDPKLYPMKYGKKMTEVDIIEIYKYDDIEKTSCRLILDTLVYICPKPVDGFACHYCIGSPLNYNTVVKKENIKKIKGMNK